MTSGSAVRVGFLCNLNQYQTLSPAVSLHFLFVLSWTQSRLTDRHRRCKQESWSSIALNSTLKWRSKRIWGSQRVTDTEIYLIISYCSSLWILFGLHQSKLRTQLSMSTLPDISDVYLRDSEVWKLASESGWKKTTEKKKATNDKTESHDDRFELGKKQNNHHKILKHFQTVTSKNGWYSLFWLLICKDLQIYLTSL